MALGGADADITRLSLTLTGNRDGEVSFNTLRVDVDLTRLRNGVVAACPAGGASGVTHGLLIDLDKEQVTFVEADEPAPARFTLKRGETEEFDIVALALTKPRLYEEADAERC